MLTDLVLFFSLLFWIMIPLGLVIMFAPLAGYLVLYCLVLPVAAIFYLLWRIAILLFWGAILLLTLPFARHSAGDQSPSPHPAMPALPPGKNP